MLKTTTILVSLLLSAPGDWSRVGKKGEWVATLGGTSLDGKLYTIESTGALYATDRG